MSACSYPHKNENSRGGGHSLISCWLVSKALLARLVDTLNVQCSCFKKWFINNLRKCTDLILIAIFCVQDMLCDPGLFTKSESTVCTDSSETKASIQSFSDFILIGSDLGVGGERESRGKTVSFAILCCHGKQDHL